MVEDVGVFAPGVLQGVGQDRQDREVARLVHLPGERDRRGRALLRVERDRAERVAEDVAE